MRVSRRVISLSKTCILDESDEFRHIFNRIVPEEAHLEPLGTWRIVPPRTTVGRMPHRQPTSDRRD